MPTVRKIITCRALAPTVRERLGESRPDIVELDIALHLQPERLRKVLLESVAGLEGEGETIALAYGLCGRALEGVVSRKSTLVLPKVDDCVGMFLGSRGRHRRVLNEHPGSYFMDPFWLDTELNIFDQIEKDLVRIPPERRKGLLKQALRHYDRLVLFSGGGPDEDAEQRCRLLAGAHDMEFRRLSKDLSLLDKLLHGSWEGPEFVVAPPGTPIPLF